MAAPTTHPSGEKFAKHTFGHTPEKLTMSLHEEILITAAIY
jgi:hypothetical protein